MDKENKEYKPFPMFFGLIASFYIFITMVVLFLVGSMGSDFGKKGLALFSSEEPSEITELKAEAPDEEADAGSEIIGFQAEEDYASDSAIGGTDTIGTADAGAAAEVTASGTETAVTPTTAADATADTSATAQTTETGTDSALTTDTESEPIAQTKYYSFTINTQGTTLNLREEPSQDAGVVAKLARTATGYVITPGNEWTQVVMPTGVTGFCATEFLTITEIREEDFPENFRSMIEAPGEEITADQYTTLLIDGATETAADTADAATADTTATDATSTDATAAGTASAATDATAAGTASAATDATAAGF